MTNGHAHSQPLTARRLIRIRGTVQGVGFRPFVFRLASELGLAGWVANSSSGVTIDAEGAQDRLEELTRRLRDELPPHASITDLQWTEEASAGYTAFVVKTSDADGRKITPVLPDLATCDDCAREIFEPGNRRYGYPFTNCTNCGPRYTIVTGLPYDRARTTMHIFAMCPACRAEYENPADRRFHAQPNACPECGPHVELWDATGHLLADRDDALGQAVDAIRRGQIVAIKGLGGFHLVVDARDDHAVRRLRERKTREEKPFALMYPSLDAVRADCDVSAPEEQILRSPASPILLLQRRLNGGVFSAAVAASVAPDNPYLGIMLPYTPLHHLLMHALGSPIVATSGNRADEPICTDEHGALTRLAGIADLFLVHNRPIARYVDDSVVRLVAGRPLLLRRARGYAPGFVDLHRPAPPILAVGAHLKNTVAIAVGDQAFLSPHIGDLETVPAHQAFRRTIDDIEHLYDLHPSTIACDRHPDYLSTQYAQSHGKRAHPVQHHYAHVLSCMVDNDLKGPVLGVSWDGTGYGLDATIWGGEFILVDDSDWSRVAHLRTFRLPGGDQAVVEPRRVALGLLYALAGDDIWERDDLAPIRAFAPQERAVLRTILHQGIQSPWTTSVGRLFDAVASLLGLRQVCAFEGQAAMQLEFAAAVAATDDVYPYNVRTDSSPAVVDWEPMIRAIVEDCVQQDSIGRVAARFHNTLAEAIVTMARHCNRKQVALTGGCFQNKYLSERTIARLDESGFIPFWHHQVPPNDGGIALGQIEAALRSQS